MDKIAKFKKGKTWNAVKYIYWHFNPPNCFILFLFLFFNDL